MICSSDPNFSEDSAATDLAIAVSELIRRLKAAADKSELNLSQTGVLSRLRRGPLTTSDLARAASMKAQSMGTILAALEQQGYVSRQEHPTDRRQILFVLTKSGIEAWGKRSKAKREWLQASIDRLEPEDRSRLIAAIPLLKRLGEASSADNDAFHLKPQSMGNDNARYYA